MNILVLVDSEFRSLIRNALERMIGNNFSKKENKHMELLLKLSIRVISSILAIKIFNNIKTITNVTEYTSYIMIAIFVYFSFMEFKQK